MGDIKKQKKKHYAPSHPWQKARIDEERTLTKEYGLKNKQEIWKMNSIMKEFAEQAKKLTTLQTEQSGVERKLLLAKLASLGLMPKDSKLEDVLTITIKDIMNRRLQTLVFKKNLARTVKQARQFIIHGHIFIGDKSLTSPSYLVSIDEEPKISFSPSSAFSSADHPERAIEEKKEPKPAKKKAKKEKKEKPKKEEKQKEKKKPEAKGKEEKPKKEEKAEKKGETKEIPEKQGISDDAQKTPLSGKPKEEKEK